MNEGGDVGMRMFQAVREWGIVFAQAFVVFVLVGWRVVRCCLARRLRSRKGQARSDTFRVILKKIAVGSDNKYIQEYHNTYIYLLLQ